MRRETIEFVGTSGAMLRGDIHLPDDRAKGAVLMAHCFTCSKDLHTQTRISGALVEAGYATMRFDFTGLGSSDGDFAATTVSSNIGDLTRAAMELVQRGYGPCGLFGHSLGGAAAILAAHRLKTVRSVVTLGAPSSPDHVRHLLGESEPEIRRLGRAPVVIGGRQFDIGNEFLLDLDEHHQGSLASELGRPLLILHAVDDTIVPVSEGEENFAAARQPKAFIPLLDTDHLVSSRPAAEIAARHIVRWFDITLG